jgi:dTDP-4-dehydrorhamnose reductase
MTASDKILVIGASGMLGSELTKQLGRRSQNIVEAIWPDDGSGRLLLDITDAAAVKKLILSVRPAEVYNCAAYTDVDKAQQEEEIATAANGTAVGYLAQACLANNSYLIHLSTDYVFDGMAKRPYRPDDATNPQGAYGRSKLAGEEAIRKVDGRWLVVRTSWLFGKGGKNFVDTILNLARQRDILKVVDDQTGCPTYVKDLAACLIGLVEADCTGIYHFCNGPACTWYDFAKKIVEIAQLPCTVKPCPSSEYPRPAKRPPYSVLDCYQTFKQLGWSPCSWEERLYEYIKVERVSV